MFLPFSDVGKPDGHPFYLRLAFLRKNAPLQQRCVSPKPSRAPHSGVVRSTHMRQSAPYGLSPLPMTAVQDRFLLPLPRMVFIPQSQREEPNSKYPAECAETVGCRSMLKHRRRHSLLSTDDLCHMVRIGKMTVIAPATRAAVTSDSRCRCFSIFPPTLVLSEGLPQRSLKTNAKDMRHHGRHPVQFKCTGGRSHSSASGWPERKNDRP